MWNSSLWEQENQEKIKADYFERLRNALRIPMFILSGVSSAEDAEKCFTPMSEAKNIAMKDVAISVSGNTSEKNGWKRERI